MIDPDFIIKVDSIDMKDAGTTGILTRPKISTIKTVIVYIIFTNDLLAEYITITDILSTGIMDTTTTTRDKTINTNSKIIAIGRIIIT